MNFKFDNFYICRHGYNFVLAWGKLYQCNPNTNYYDIWVDVCYEDWEDKE